MREPMVRHLPIDAVANASLALASLGPFIFIVIELTQSHCYWQIGRVSESILAS